MKKKWFKYFIFALTGFVIDESLKYYNMNLPYSFVILFTNISLYKIRYKDMMGNGQTLDSLLKVFVFGVLPVVYSLLSNL